MTSTQTPTAHVIQYAALGERCEMTAAALREMARLLDLQAAGTLVRLIHADGTGDLVGRVTNVYFSDGSVAVNVVADNGQDFSFGPLYGGRVEVVE